VELIGELLLKRGDVGAPPALDAPGNGHGDHCQGDGADH
jgi:hypothetical protein